MISDAADRHFFSVLTRQLNRPRHGAGERITDNTLIRVAIDLLLQQRDHLAGVTEADLSASVVGTLAPAGMLLIGWW